MTLIAVILSSLAVAVCWGANLGAIYPIVDIVLKGRSLHTWVEDNIKASRADCAKWRALVAEKEQALAQEPGAEARRGLQRERTYYVARLEAEQAALHRARQLRPWIRRYMPEAPFLTLIVVVTALIVGTVIKTGFMVVNTLVVERLALGVAFRLRQQLFRKSLDLDVAALADGHTSEWITYFTNDAECLSAGVRTLFGRAIREPLKIAICLCGAALICWRLLLFSLIASPLALYLISRLAQSIKRASRRALQEMSNLHERLSESLSGIELIKAFGRERFERRQFHAISKEYTAKSLRIAFYQALTKPINELVGIGVIASALLVGGYLVLNEETHLGMLRMSQRPLNFGSLMTFFALLAGISDPFRKLADVYGDVQRGAAAADRVFTALDRAPQMVDPVKPQPVATFHSLQFERVCFRYRDTAHVLKLIDLEIQAGQTVAIVGPNGCGKTTLTKLVPRFYDPTSGAVRWNGVDLREYRRRDLRARIGIVSQQTLLFNDTVLNNIRYGSPKASLADVHRAAHRAYAHEFIEAQLPHGYDTVVGQGGKSLSGGQRQRLAMARALLCEPELLILDEATSQIDLESEQLIRESLRKFTQNRTALVITHRLETLEICDQIVVMQEGTIRDMGTHEQLLRRCGLYRRLHEIQFKIPA
jgi:ATP-binding cassette subfamily B protein/subfamily B ATP-binding cassette protein MsbA